MILLFAPEDTIQRCANLLVSADAGVIVSSHGVAPLFQTGDSGGPYTFKLPTQDVSHTYTLRILCDQQQFF